MPLVLAVSLAGCTVVPHRTAVQACGLLESATQEGGMVATWYEAVAPLLEACGVPGGREWAERKLCDAMKHDNRNYVCEVGK